MRFILFIALALLPLSTALMCYHGKGAHIGSTFTELQRGVSLCKLGYCTFEDVIGQDKRHELTWKCADSGRCDQEGCLEQIKGKRTINFCCCSTDFCNESMVTAKNSLSGLASSISGPAPSSGLESRISSLESKMSDLAFSNDRLASSIDRLASEIFSPAPSNDSIGAPL